jgi:hypothetical protein
MSARSKLSFTEVGAVFVTLATVTLEAERLQVVQSVSAPSALPHDMIDVKRLILGGSSTKQTVPIAGHRREKFSSGGLALHELWSQPSI